MLNVPTGMNRDGAGREASLESTSAIASGDRIVAATNHDIREPISTQRDLNSLPNRRMRTRMSGGVGRAVSNDRPYPILRRCDSAVNRLQVYQSKRFTFHCLGSFDSNYQQRVLFMT